MTADKLNGGMCPVIYDLCYREQIINPNEFSILMDYLNEHKPVNALKREKQIFRNNGMYQENRFWWKPLSVAPRIKWLNEQIEKL